jgi:hypothetical protein
MPTCSTAHCPLCGGPNGCPLARPGTDPAGCWCHQTEFPESILARIPPEARDVACVCHACVAQARRREGWNPRALPGESYFTPDGRFVFTARYHLRRGYCCGNGCRHCPFDTEGRPRPDALEPAK